MNALQQKQAELAQRFARLGELDIVAGDIERERAQARAGIAECRAALQAMSACTPPAVAPADVPTVKMKRVKPVRK